MLQEMAKNACEDDPKLSLLVEGIVIKAQTEITNEKSEIIRDVIRFHINTWLDQVEQINPLYKVSELIPVGSYAEGTKIIRADEFDYLAVIEELSKPDVIEIDTSESDINKGLVKVVIADEESKLKWSGLCKDGHLRCFQPINFPGMGEKRFGHVVIDTVFKFIRNLKRKFTSAKTPTAIEDCIIVLPAVNDVTLFFKGAVFRAPNVILNFEYENRKISVDVSPAIRYHKIHDCFKVEDCAGPEFAEVVLRRKSLLLVGTESESDFKVTVTEAEVEYILTVMKPEHKIIYVFLKYIVKLYERVLLDTFTSYIMKTVCIHHDIKCKKDDRSIIDCLQSVINDLNVCRQQYFVISIVNKHIHLVSYMNITKDKECLLQGMTAMCQLPAEIETVEEFDTFMKRIVDSERQKRYVGEYLCQCIISFKVGLFVYQVQIAKPCQFLGLFPIFSFFLKKR
jgi:hypothetical protein